jgi:predicted dehydrogenase
MKIGIVGAGSMGHLHAASWAELRTIGAEPIGILANHPHGPVSQIAKAHGLRVYESYDALVADVDIVDLCVPTDLHHPMAMQAASARKHLVVEKPIALTVADGRAMIDACAAAGVRLFIAMVLRYVPQYAAASQVVLGGQIGKPAVMRLTRASYQPRKAIDNWFVDEARSGGMILDLMIHDYDYARWLAGNVVRVYARSVRALRPEAPGDYALVTLRFANGGIAHIEGGWAYPPGNFRTSIDIAGTDGVLEWTSDTAEPLHTYLAHPPATEAADVGVPASLAEESPFTAELRHFYTALLNNQPFSVTAEDGLAALQIALAARESLRTGRSITINQEAI